MLEIASQIVLCLLLAALLGFIIGYLLGKSTCADDGCHHANDATSHDATHEDSHTSHEIATQSLSSAALTKDSADNEPEHVSIHDDDHTSHETPVQSLSSATLENDSVDNEPEPLLLSGPRDGEKDNLTRIKGIGVKIEEALNDIGIYHFDQIAAWSAENITWADTNLGFPGRAEREEWVEQAKALAKGAETEFSKRVDAGKVSSSKQS